MKRYGSSRQTLFIYLLIWVSVRELHHHISCRSDDLPSQKNILYSEGLDPLEAVFRRLYLAHLEQQKQIVSQHHLLNCHPVFVQQFA
jgi:hypothetical protein